MAEKLRVLPTAFAGPEEVSGKALEGLMARIQKDMDEVGLAEMVLGSERPVTMDSKGVLSLLGPNFPHQLAFAYSLGDNLAARRRSHPEQLTLEEKEARRVERLQKVASDIAYELNKQPQFGAVALYLLHGPSISEGVEDMVREFEDVEQAIPVAGE